MKDKKYSLCTNTMFKSLTSVTDFHEAKGSLDISI